MTKIFKVGGCVRDGLLGLKSKDIDFVVEAPSFEAVRQYILDSNGQIFLEKPEFLTIRAIVPNLGAADFVLCRKDGEYVDGRRPESVTPGTIFDDLARRDFTMNAIAECVETGEIVDPHDGRKHIKSRLIACVGNPLDRFKEDKLRIFRAVRFAITKGFAIRGDVTHAMKQFSHEDFAGVSTERIRDEVLKMFAKDSMVAFNALFITFPLLGELVLSRGIWFEPTTRKP